MFRLNAWRPVATALILAAVSLTPTAAHAADPGATIERPEPGLTVRTIAQIAGVPTSEPAPAHALVISSPRTDLAAEDARRLATGQGVSGVTVLRSARDVAPSTTVATLTNGRPATSAKYFIRECVLYPDSDFCCIPVVIIWIPSG